MQNDKKTIIDISEEIQSSFYKAWGFDNSEKYIFYYDESNNCRKFWIDDKHGHFNSDYTEDFVLAGVAVKNVNVNISLEELKQLLGLQKNVKEIKFKNQFS